MDPRRIAEHLGLTEEDLPDALSAVAVQAYQKYRDTGDQASIDIAVQCAQYVINITPEGHPQEAGRLNNLGVMLGRRYERTGLMGDLEEAITAARQAVQSTPDDHPDRAACLNNLGNKLGRRYERTGQMGDLEEAITAVRQAVQSTLDDHPDWAGYLNNLGNMLESWYERTGQMGDLKEAITAARQAVQLTLDDHPDWAGYLNNLGNKLESRYERTGQMGDLEEAITAARQVVQSTLDNYPDRAGYLNNLGNKLESRYKRTGQMGDLEEAITAARQAVQSTPDDHPDRAGYLNNLGNMLESRYERTGQMGGLEEAITAARQAVQSTPDDHPDRAGCLNNLGKKLGRRYERTGQMGDLEEAITAARQAIQSTPDDHPDRAGRLNNLGNMLESQYKRTGQMGDLEEAITAARQAVQSTPDDHPDRVACLNNLGNKLESRYERTGQMGDLKEAITVARQAVQLTLDDHPDWVGRLNNLGNKLESWYERTGQMGGLEEAITAARQAVQSTPDDHPDRAACLNNLGNKLGRRYERTGQMGDLEVASEHLQEAWSCSAAVPFHRIKSAARCLQLFGRLRGGPHPNVVLSAIQLGKEVIELLPTVNTRLLNRADQQFVVKTFAGVAADLCAFHLESDRLDDALLYLEKGRAVILGQLVDARSDISSLAQQYPDLVRRYEELRDEINRPVQTGKQDAAERLMLKRRREAVADLERCIKGIRSIPGQEQFLQGQTVAQMQECAAHGSIIIINLTTLRGDAIIVSATTIKALNLPKLSASEAKSWLSKDWHGGRRSERPQKNKEYLDFLSWLWQACVQPVLDMVLAVHSSSDLPRIWWIGTGLATSMPFHAAGTHSANSTDNLYNRAVSSYAPSIKALAYAHSRAKAADRTKDTLLIATMSTTPGSPKPPDLPGVAKEKEKLLDIASTHLLTESLDQPSVNRLIERLPHCSVAHFACHGSTDYSDPSNSGLILQKCGGTAPEQDRLTVQTVSGLSLTHARLAYLSACSTAENKAARLTDEVIHVVSGFQVAGFPHVVGCLWPSNDRTCVEVAGGFYTALLGQGGMRWDNDDVAAVLRKAVMAVRAKERSLPLNWAQFVHYGP